MCRTVRIIYARKSLPAPSREQRKTNKTIWADIEFTGASSDGPSGASSSGTTPAGTPEATAHNSVVCSDIIAQPCATARIVWPLLTRA